MSFFLKQRYMELALKNFRGNFIFIGSMCCPYIVLLPSFSDASNRFLFPFLPTADADNSDSELPDQYSRVTLAPDDADILDAYGLCNVKTNTFGLGYVPLSRDNVLGQRQDWMMGQPLSLGATKDNKKISFSGQVGVSYLKTLCFWEIN